MNQRVDCLHWSPRQRYQRPLLSKANEQRTYTLCETLVQAHSAIGQEALVAPDVNDSAHNLRLGRALSDCKKRMNDTVGVPEVKTSSVEQHSVHQRSLPDAIVLYNTSERGYTMIPTRTESQ